MNKTKARQPNRLARLSFDPSRASFGSAPSPAAGNIREPLDDRGKALLDQLSGKLCLRMTARDFPHIVNRLGAFGYQAARMVQCIDALLINDRPSRQGFPFAVVQELSALRAFYARLPQY